MSATATERRDLAFAGVARQAELARGRAISPRELVEIALERIERLDPQVNAFRAVFAEQALAEADAAGGRSGDAHRPLLGVPIAVKDDTPLAGVARVRGSHGHAGPEPQDAGFVARLRDAGAIVIGVTRTPELTLWPFTETVQGGATRNPWSLDRTPGGSSGGSGAAVSAALVPAATASDGAGSIRIPAACCGLFGLKTQRGLISTAPLPDVWSGLGVYGFLTRSVADSALLYEVATGRPYLAATQRDPGRLRIALSLKIPPGVVARLGSEQRRATHETADLLRSLGHEVIERDPSYGLIGRNVMVRYLAGAHSEAQTMAHPARMERRTRRMVRLGAAVRPLRRGAIGAQDADARRINAIFEHVDAILTPTLTAGPLPIGRFDGRGALRTFNGATGFVAFNPLWNHIGNPAAAIPAGFDGDGLPLSAHLAAAPHGEEMLLSLALQLETARPWATARPPVS